MKPTTEDELAEAIATARGPLAIRGGGTRPVGVPTAGAQVLDTTGLAGVTLYEPAALTLVVRAGTPLSEVTALLAAEGQRLPFEPPDWGAALGAPGGSRIGGVVAANASGPARVALGACRDALIGVRFVDGTGTIVKNGGRVMKNVTGYDLAKLMAGSWGTLGVLSEVAFKLLPAAPETATLVLPGLGAEAAVPVLSRALGAPLGVTGAGWMPGTGALLRLEGRGAGLAERLAAARALFPDHALDLAPDPVAPWRALASLAPLAALPGDLWRISCRPSEAPAILARLGLSRLGLARPGLAAGPAQAAPVLLDWGGGLIWARLPEGCDARALAAPFAGHATRFLPAGPGAFAPEPAPVAALSCGLRARFDPQGRLNPGRMG
ncbi:FAD-binding protein [Phaeovulum vinaykumarii]|uniref:Glycolate oxidase FAD binding subunit n=1 Tax=Phaeovulum vinaykumarii TaxID=407234 RepID=A0A1N7KRX0_9RHOB|nr:FAD-binding protein [Phaeovulum vinaykumarii]SIS64297.1 glycolate oxidase FAD binding subunit [Phaeovulum vinaykumarii]SOC01620.1 glycolate oxidase FAD binding subunit [Phaeovulum vinaykumarii]